MHTRRLRNAHEDGNNRNNSNGGVQPSSGQLGSRAAEQRLVRQLGDGQPGSWVTGSRQPGSEKPSSGHLGRRVTSSHMEGS